MFLGFCFLFRSFLFLCLMGILSPFNICCKADLVMLNTLNWLVQIFWFLHQWIRSLQDIVIFVLVFFFSSNTLWYIRHFSLSCRVTVVILLISGVFLVCFCCFLPAALSTFSYKELLLINMCWCVTSRLSCKGLSFLNWFN